VHFRIKELSLQLQKERDSKERFEKDLLVANKVLTACACPFAHTEIGKAQQ
jgi:hypothetical protein